MPKPNVEKLSLHFDIERLVECFEEHIQPLPPAYCGSKLHGWSLFSTNGDYRDGWHDGSSVYKREDNDQEFDNRQAQKIRLIPDTEYNIPTEIYKGYIKDVIEQLKDLGFHPCRPRIMGLPPHSGTLVHQDHRDGFYWVRFHVPIITNSNCFFETEQEKFHMAADGSSYLVNTSVPHKAVNEGDTLRYHLVVQVWDTQNISQHWNYPEKDIRVW